MDVEVQIRVVLVAPPAGVDFGVQRGTGSHYEPLFVQRSNGADISFEFSVPVAESGKSGQPNFRGPFAQGPPAARFIYIDVGACAGQADTQWSRRMKIPLQGITWTLVRKALKSGGGLAATVQGTGRDGGPNCATVELLGGWQVIRAGD